MIWTSLLGIAALVAAAWWFGFGKPQPLVDAEAAKRLVADALVGFRPLDAVLDAKGCGALVTGADGETALVRSHGDRWVVRRLPQPVAADAKGAQLIVRLDEFMFGAVTLTLDDDMARAWAARLNRQAA